MKGRLTFTRAEIAVLLQLIRDKQTADRSRQKTLRARMRRIGFFIGDFSDDSDGFVEADFNELLHRGVIAVIDDSASPTAASHLRQKGAGSAGEAASALAVTSDETHRLGALVADALEALLYKARPLADAMNFVPHQPGLYAFHGPTKVWHELGLGDPPDGRPLYVGKAQEDLVSRDVMTHLRDGGTGWSTLRRSVAALLRARLGLEGQPRNPQKPERFANFGLSPERDRLLTAWLVEHLHLAVWPLGEMAEISLGEIERHMLARLQPPLNLKGVSTPWTAHVLAERAVMAGEAAAWAARDTLVTV